MESFEDFWFLLSPKAKGLVADSGNGTTGTKRSPRRSSF
jgi:hypothetical protein